MNIFSRCYPPNILEVRNEEKKEERERDREGGSDWRSEQEELRRLSGRMTDLKGVSRYSLGKTKEEIKRKSYKCPGIFS